MTSDLLTFTLTDDEVEVLTAGLDQWGGPARPTQELAVALGWGDLADLDAGCDRLSASIRARDALSALDWTRALVLVEVTFASDVFGAGYEWSTVTGLDDAQTLNVLRRLQVKLVSAFGPTVGNGLGTRD